MARPKERPEAVPHAACRFDREAWSAALAELEEAASRRDLEAALEAAERVVGLEAGCGDRRQPPCAAAVQAISAWYELLATGREPRGLAAKVLAAYRFGRGRGQVEKGWPWWATMNEGPDGKVTRR